MASIQIFEHCDLYYLAWVIDGDEGSPVCHDWLLSDEHVARLQAGLAASTLSEWGEGDLENSYVVEAIMRNTQFDATATVRYEVEVLIFRSLAKAKIAKKAAAEGIKRFKAEKKAAARKAVVEPYWAPLARAAGWTPPCASPSTLGNTSAPPSSPTTDNS